MKTYYLVLPKDSEHQVELIHLMNSLAAEVHDLHYRPTLRVEAPDWLDPLFKGLGALDITSRMQGSKPPMIQRHPDAFIPPVDNSLPDGPEPSGIAPDPDGKGDSGDLPDNPLLEQQFTWLVVGTEMQFNSPSYALSHNKLAIGQLVNHKVRGLHRVIEKNGRRTLQRVERGNHVSA